MNLKGKGSQAKNRYNRELESYKWFVVDLKENKAITGYEYKSDALDVLSDYDDRSRYKVVSEISLKKLGIENPKEMWKYKMAKGGGLGNENALMVANNNKQIFHHTKEMSEALKGAKNVPAWVVAKVNRSASDLSDATHYLEGAEGMYAKGGGVSEIDMDNVQKQAEFYTNEKKWSTKPTIEKFESELKEYENLKYQLDNNLIKPSKIIGTGIKPNLVKPLAYKYVNEKILIAKKAIEILKERENNDVKGGGIEDLTPVELYFRNLDYSKLPESFSNFIKTEILTDPELKYLSEREPIFIEIKEKVEKYENQNAGKVEEAEGESISDLIAGLEVLVPISTKKEKKELLDLIEGLKLLL